jgi:hypothetical protein
MAKLGLLYIGEGNENTTAAVENHLTVSQKVKYRMFEKLSVHST